MSVLVKGMEMPKKCGSCPCFHAEHPMYCQAVKADKTKRIAAPYGLPRPDWCPLIEVPPHGRLIDEDALISKINYTDNFYETPFVDWDDILEAPTVIPADKDGET